MQHGISETLWHGRHKTAVGTVKFKDRRRPTRNYLAFPVGDGRLRGRRAAYWWGAEWLLHRQSATRISGVGLSPKATKRARGVESSLIKLNAPIAPAARQAAGNQATVLPSTPPSAPIVRPPPARRAMADQRSGPSARGANVTFGGEGRRTETQASPPSARPDKIGQRMSGTGDHARQAERRGARASAQMQARAQGRRQPGVACHHQQQLSLPANPRQIPTKRRPVRVRIVAQDDARGPRGNAAADARGSGRRRLSVNSHRRGNGFGLRRRPHASRSLGPRRGSGLTLSGNDP